MKTRRILSALLAAAMTCAMCLSVGAADAPATSVDGYPINANGETYGSYLDILKYGYPPQLIRAIGDNNQTGYLRLADFRADNRPSNANAVWTIYDLNGTVIDTFGK